MIELILMFLNTWVALNTGTIQKSKECHYLQVTILIYQQQMGPLR